ncbi:putative Snf7 family protein [Helianthus anomalus]
MDEINEQTEKIKQFQEALSTPIGATTDFDEEELKAELERAELEEQLLQPVITAHAAPLLKELIRPVTTANAGPLHVPAGKQPAPPTQRQNTAEEDELAALRAGMALYIGQFSTNNLSCDLDPVMLCA